MRLEKIEGRRAYVAPPKRGAPIAISSGSRTAGARLCREYREASLRREAALRSASSEQAAQAASQPNVEVLSVSGGFSVRFESRTFADVTDAAELAKRIESLVNAFRLERERARSGR